MSEDAPEKRFVVWIERPAGTALGQDIAFVTQDLVKRRWDFCRSGRSPFAEDPFIAGYGWAFPTMDEAKAFADEIDRKLSLRVEICKHRSPLA